MEVLPAEASVLKWSRRQEAFGFRKICHMKLNTQFLSLKVLIPHNHCQAKQSDERSRLKKISDRFEPDCSLHSAVVFPASLLLHQTH